MPHDFDTVDTTVLEVIKDNIVAVLKTVVHQKTLESIVRQDLYSGLYSEEYLYGEGRKIIDQYTISTVCMFRINNLEEINLNYSRELGNQVITDLSVYIKQNISREYVFVRYMGPKFVIVFSGVDETGVANFLNDLKENIDKMQIRLRDEDDNIIDETQVAVPKVNFVISNYYKGTGLEEVLKKQEQYLDSQEHREESDITRI